MNVSKNKKIFSAFSYLISVVILFCFFVYIRLSQPEFTQKNCFTKHYIYFKDRIPPMKVFLYNLSLPLQSKVSKTQYINAIPAKLAHTTVFEYIAYRNIMNYPFRTVHPNDADLFFVPLFGALFNGHKEEGDIDEVITPQLKLHGNYFERYGGVDHAFIQMLFSQENIPITVEKQRHLASMITLGDLNFNYSRDNMRESWRNINFPLTSNIPQNEDVNATEKRPISAFFIGQIELSGFDEVAAPIRRGMALEMKSIPHSIVINAKRYDPFHSVYSYNFSRMMVNSEFCCAPHGDGPTTKRLFDTFRTLCIPIVLSDEIKFPFEDLFVDYSHIVIQIPAFEPHLIPLVMSLPTNAKKIEMRENMLKISHLLEQDFNYDIRPGSLMWGWLWIHYFKLCVVAASKRRNLLQSAYL